MLRRAAARTPWWKRAVGARAPRFACADLQALPFAVSSAGLAFSNLTLQWCDAKAVFAEAARVLEKDGLLLFSTLGPDTLREAVGIVAGRAITEASGGIRPDTALAIAATGVDLLSVGSLTHSAQVLDIGLDHRE